MSEKLVRDRIPEIIRASGDECRCRTASEDEYMDMLIAKLDEEVAEYKESRSLEELADVMEVLVALAAAGGHTEGELREANLSKRRERGGFSERIVLIR